MQQTPTSKQTQKQHATYYKQRAHNNKQTANNNEQATNHSHAQQQTGNHHEKNKSTAIKPLVSSSTVHADATAAAAAAAVDSGCEAQPIAHEVASDADAQLIMHPPHAGLDAITAATPAAGPFALVVTSASSAIEHAAAITQIWHR